MANNQTRYSVTVIAWLGQDAWTLTGPVYAWNSYYARQAAFREYLGRPYQRVQVAEITTADRLAQCRPSTEQELRVAGFEADQVPSVIREVA